MKTSLNIPDNDLRDLMRNTRAKTKRDAIVTAIQDYNYRRKLDKALKLMGTSDTFMPLEKFLKHRGES